MAQTQLDALLVLRDIAGGPITGTQAETAVAMDLEHVGEVVMVAHASAVGAANADETYTVALEAGTAQAGPFTEVARGAYPRDRGPGEVIIAVHGDAVEAVVPGATWARLNTTLAGTAPSITLGCYVSKATMGKIGLVNDRGLP